MFFSFKLWVIFLVSSILFLPSCDSSQEQSSTIDEVIDAHVNQFVQVDGPGLTVAVMHHGKVVFEKGYGMADIEAGLTVERDARFYLSSVSKQITSMAVMLLYEEGLLDFDDRIVNTFPEAPQFWSAITIHHLLTHQSGLVEYIELPGLANWTNQDVLDFAVEVAPEFAAGTRFKYSNTGYVLLAMLVERVSGLPFETFVHEKIFTPLGLNQSVVADPSRPFIPSRAVGYWPNGNLHDYNLRTMGDGGIFSSLNDMEIWIMGLFSSDLLRPETLDLAFASYDKRGYGYGWEVDKINRKKRVYHAGALVGYASHVSLIPKDKFAVVVLSNGTFRDEVSQLARKILFFYH